MTARVQVVVEAKDASSGVLRAITSQFGALGNVVEELTAKNINWGNVAQQATTMVIDGLKESVRATLEYADQVRSLSAISGQSTEETSRFIQVLDDYGLSAQDAEQATRALTQRGLVPNIDTLAKLSDQYLALNDSQARNELIIKNLGRSGLQWVDVLKQGGAALREQAAAVEGSLILSEQQVQAARENEIATDRWNDAVQGLKISIGNELLPILTTLANSLMDNANAQDLARAAGEKNIPTYVLVARGYSETAVAAREAHDAAMASATGFDAAGQSASGLVKNFDKVISTAQQLGDVTAESAKKAAFAMLQLKLASDGSISPEDERMLEQAGVALGVVDQGSLQAAKSIDTLTEMFIAGTITAKQYAAALNAIPEEINTTVTTSYTTSSGATAHTGSQQGGEVFAGQPHYVGERGPEPFIPAMNGRILGHAESLAALANGGAGSTNYFYGNVTLEISEEGAGGIMSAR